MIATHMKKRSLNLVTCSLCKHVSKSLEEFEKHIRLDHDDEGLHNTEPKTEINKYTCTKCDICLESEDMLIIHDKEHDEENLKCSSCSFKTASDTEMSSHVQISDQVTKVDLKMFHISLHIPAWRFISA